VLEILIGMAESDTPSEFDKLNSLAGEAFAIAYGAREGSTDSFVDYEAERHYIGFKKAHNLAGSNAYALAGHLVLLEAAQKKFDGQYRLYHEPTNPTEQ